MNQFIRRCLFHASAIAALATPACGGVRMVQAPMPSAGAADSGVTSMQAESAPPNTPTASNVAIATDILRACTIADEGAYFEFDSARISTFDYAPLDQVASCFAHGPMAGYKLDVVGHADPRGTPEYNLTLGQSRADAVEGYLVGKGLRPTQVVTTSRGALDATGHDEPGWAHDRRVDVLLAK